MAQKNKLTKAAIERIVSLRNDKFSNYTFQDIADVIADEFGIQITGQTAGYHYRKNKDIQFSESIAVAPITHSAKAVNAETESDNQLLASGLPRRNIKKNLKKPKEYDASFVDDLSNEDIEKLFSSK